MILLHLTGLFTSLARSEYAGGGPACPAVRLNPAEAQITDIG